MNRAIFLIGALALLIVAMSAQRALAMEMLIHNHEVPPQGRTLKYEFFNESIHYVYFATRTVYQGANNIIINVPDDKFQPGDMVKGCVIGLGINPFTLCADIAQAGDNGLEYDFDVF
jgi:exosome complex RNA-binding protein Csl4